MSKAKTHRQAGSCRVRGHRHSRRHAHSPFSGESQASARGVNRADFPEPRWATWPEEGPRRYRFTRVLRERGYVNVVGAEASGQPRPQPV